MDEIKNMDRDDVLDIIETFPIKPLNRKVIITLNMEEVDGGLVLSENQLSETQYVIAADKYIIDVKAGDKVLLDLDKLMEFVPSSSNSEERRSRIKVRPIQYKDKMFAMINSNIIDAIDTTI